LSVPVNTQVFPANSLAATFSQPAFPEARTTTGVRVELNSYPVLVAPVNVDQEIFPGYHQLRFAFGPERYFPFINFRAGVYSAARDADDAEFPGVGWRIFRSMFRRIFLIWQVPF
jgi:hypothetical protein